MGVWIEIHHIGHTHLPNTVTPYVGVWIEIGYRFISHVTCSVTPYVGVWIEICRKESTPKLL